MVSRTQEKSLLIVDVIPPIENITALRKLDQKVMMLASFGLSKWTRGLNWESTSEGYLLQRSQLEELIIDMEKAPSEPVKEIIDILDELNIIQKKPNYEGFELILKEVKKKYKTPKIVFLLGAGASKPSPSNIPSINEMLKVIVSKLPPVENPVTNKIRQWSERRNINIEDIMTAGYISTNLINDLKIHNLVGEIIYRGPTKEDIERNRVLRGRVLYERELRDVEYVYSFKDVLDRIFSTVAGIMSQADSNSVHENIAKLIKNNENKLDIKILTTNYDLCMEKALLKEGLKLKYLGLETGEGVPLVKIHGSLNWYYCEGCQEVIQLTIDDINKMEKIYPTTGSCLKCYTTTELFMIPPIAYKYVMYPPLVDIWQNAMQVLQEANIIIVIGYSFSTTDDYILKMIVNGLKKRDSKFILLNRNRESRNNLEQRLQTYHENIDLSIIEDASISTEIVCNILRKSELETST
jgi:NAD-dependent SIR2 family protein deacetylase